jgi:SWI/SNF-related matrix-associated actin-dependent regulator of chromatin subfamily A3
MESEDDRRLWDNLKKVEKDAKQSDSLMVSSPSGSLLSAQDYLTADTDVTRLPLHPHPPGIASGQLMVDLLPHQSQALQVKSIDVAKLITSG